MVGLNRSCVCRFTCQIRRFEQLKVRQALGDRPSSSRIEATQFRHDGRDESVPAVALILAVTASAMDQDRARIMAAGFNAYQRKPISVKELLLTVEALLPARKDTAGA